MCVRCRNGSPRYHGRAQRPDPTDLRLVRALRLEGLRLKVIAHKFDIDRRTLYRWLHDYAPNRCPNAARLAS